jgi:hypothetical protein
MYHRLHWCAAVCLLLVSAADAQRTEPRSGSSPRTPTQSEWPATRIAEEAQKAGIPLRGDTSFAPVSEADFDAVMKKMSAAKPG